jgi:antitoxin Phd_YefM of type II toxin-antitoxin system
MTSYSFDEACTTFAKLVGRALAGEPQRVIHHGKGAVVIVSEDQWLDRCGGTRSLGSLLAQHARGGSMRGQLTHRPWKNRVLGSDFA